MLANVGVKNQRDYFNMVVAIKSIYNPIKVLKIISIIENDMGRVRKRSGIQELLILTYYFLENKLSKQKN